MRKYLSDENLRKELLEGTQRFVKIIASTLGPKGNLVALADKEKCVSTKDGATVAKNISFDDNSFQNIAAKVIRQASIQTEKDAGDGTSTAVVLTGAILEEAQKYLAAGVPAIELIRGIEKATKYICENITSFSVPIRSKQDIENIATISANNDKTIGKLIATAIDKAGKDGSLLVEEARSSETTLELIEGFRFDSGYAAGAFITNEQRQSVHFDNPLILVTDEKINDVREMMSILEIVARDGRPFVIIADEVKEKALAAFIMNAARGTMPVVVVKAPRYGEERRNIMKDLCLAVGATFVSKETGIKLSEAKLEHLGSSKTIDVIKNSTTIVDGKYKDYSEIEKRIEQLKTEIRNTDNIPECERIQERIIRLASGVAVIYVGGATEIEMIEKKHRIEDAVEAVKSAQAEGIVSGGGTIFIRSSKDMQKIKTENELQDFGLAVMKAAVKKPFKLIVENAGESYDVLLQKILKSKTNGFNASKNKIENDIIKAGIVDPTRVSRCALQNAVSAACSLIMTKNAVVEE